MKKCEQRAYLKGFRREMSKEEVAEKSVEIAENFYKISEFRSAETVFIYISLSKEASTFEIIDRCLKSGKRVVVPVTTAGEISPCILENTENLEVGEFGISEPKEKKPWTGKIDIAVVPGLGFDRQGNRMGFGKGCYDKFLAEHNSKKVGLCFDNMLQKKIATEVHDVPMDMVITETEIIYTGGDL